MAAAAKHRVAVAVVGKPLSTVERVQVCGGLGYLVLTVCSTLWYMLLLGPTLSNNFYTPNFNRSGYETFLVDIVNAKLVGAGRSSAVDLFSPDAAMTKDYSTAVAQPEFAPTYARHVLFGELNTLPRAILDLRNTTRATRVYTQYCWLDLDRRWDVAHTAARSARCRERYMDNAAVYIEVLVRNVDWGEFMESSGAWWEIAIVVTLRQSVEGRQWLSDRPVHSRVLTVADEVAFLTTKKLTRYDLTWQNRFTPGIAESIELENALGLTQRVTIKSLPASTGPWTSLILYWNFLNDLWMCTYFNASLIRTAENHFDRIGAPVEAIYGMQDANGTFPDQLGAFRTNLGPIGSVDAFMVPLPGALISLATTFQVSLFGQLWASPELRAKFETLGTIALTPLPPALACSNGTLLCAGGNILCQYNSPTSVPQSQLSYNDNCGSQSQFTMIVSAQALVFALQASGATNVDAICALQGSPGCHAAVVQAMALRDATPALPASLVADAVGQLPAIHFFQYAQHATTKAWLVLQQPLLTPSDTNWSFYGWMALFEWALHRREVVRLEGDVDTFTLMSEMYSHEQLITGGDSSAAGTQSDTKIVYVLVAYVSGLLAALAVAVIAFTLLSRGRVVSQNLLRFNRVTGCVWVGRPLLMLRGLTAVLMLSTTQVDLERRGLITMLRFDPRSILDTMIVVGEASWVVYVLLDVVLVVIGSDAVRLVAPVSSALTWFVLVVLEVGFPIQLTAAFNRVCTVQETDKLLRCTSGIAKLGSWHRISVLLLIQCGALVVAIAVGCAISWHRRRQDGHLPPAAKQSAALVLHGAAEAFLVAYGQDNLSHIDNAACVMTGLIPLTLYGRQFTLDVKLWVLIPTQAIENRFGGGVSAVNVLARTDASVSPSKGSGKEDEVSDAKAAPTSNRRWPFLKALSGLVYILFSAIGSVSYIALSSVNFANDFYWATFNMTGHHVAVAVAFVEQLSLGRPLVDGRLDEPTWVSTDINFTNPAVRGTYPPFWGSALQQSAQVTDLVRAINGLRATEACTIPWIFTQYCWVDFARQWPMANTAARQLRCSADATMKSNGAMYLESALRNVQWKDWSACWGTSFETAFGIEIRRTDGGKAWLDAVQTSDKLVADEVADWMAAGIQYYKVQWQNFKLPGLINTYAIENAFGVQYPMTLVNTNGTYRIASQTTYKMYWGLASDLWTVQENATLVGGKSLIRTSPNYAFANVTMLDVLVQNGTMRTPLFEAFRVVERSIGPFGAIDMVVVPCPQSAKDLYAAGLDLLRRIISFNDAAAADYVNITMLSTDTLKPFPKQFRDNPMWYVFGGSLLCQDFSSGSPVWNGLLQWTARTGACGQLLITDFQSTRDKMLVSALAARLGRATPADIASVCSHQANPAICRTTYVGISMAFLNRFVPTTALAKMESLATAALADIVPLQPSMIQYVRRNKSLPLEMMRTPLFDPQDPTFHLWNWMVVLDWASNGREVVRFEGDVGFIHAITEFQMSIAQPVNPHEFPTTFALYARTGVQYVTGALLGVTGLVVVYVLLNRSNLESYNLFELNRVAGIVWIGRPLLVLRGVTALCFLSTSTLELGRDNQVAHFSVTEVAWYQAILSAGETTWLVYVLNDLAMIWTKDFTFLYATSSSQLVWAVAAVYTLLNPVMHSASLAVDCAIDQMDFQLVCTSGVVRIGQISRLYTLLGIIGVCNVVCFAYAMWKSRRAAVQPQSFHSSHESLLLCSGAKYLFTRDEWLYEGVHYMDPASALLNGLVSVRWKQGIYVMDIKLWRSLRVNVPTTAPRHLKKAIAMPES